ncbi:hypothetical protein PWP93_28905 [Paraburkholderia sp. A1RI-2L]|uniref:hypothetical protein n=1 Tax=Paraburkholderia sp. A1RI-2L TaxID=3028367 RepID=UPI003B7F1B5F
MQGREMRRIAAIDATGPRQQLRQQLISIKWQKYRVAIIDLNVDFLNLLSTTLFCLAIQLNIGNIDVR